MKKLFLIIFIFAALLSTAFSRLNYSFKECEAVYGSCDTLKRIDDRLVCGKWLIRGVSVFVFFLDNKAESVLYKNGDSGWSREQIIKFIQVNCPQITNSNEFQKIDDNSAVYHLNQPDEIILTIQGGDCNFSTEKYKKFVQDQDNTSGF